MDGSYKRRTKDVHHCEERAGLFLHPCLQAGKADHNDARLTLVVFLHRLAFRRLDQLPQILVAVERVVVG